MSRVKNFSRLLVALLFFYCAWIFVWAQGEELGRIEGTVTDKSGGVVAGVSVTAKNRATGFERMVISEENGYYRIPSLQPGTYMVTAELTGFTKFVVQEAVVNVGRSTNINITLAPAGVEEAVTVTAAAAIVDVSKTDVGGVVDNREVTNLPLNGRNFSALATLIPGARPVGAWDPTKTRIGAVSIAGAGGRNINTTIDGIDNKDNTVGGYVQNISIEAIQEFALKTQRFSAADGRSQGGLLSIVTKSGANDFHGSGFGFFRHTKLNAKDYFTKKNNGSKPDFSRQQFGGSIGGPVIKEKAFFFFAFERLQEDQFVIVSQDRVRELSALRNAGVSIYGLTPNPATQIPTPFRNDLTSARIDFAISPKNNAYLSWSENRDNTLNDQDPQDLTSSNFNKNKNELFSFVLNSVVSPTKLNQFVFGYSYWNNLIDTNNFSPVTVYFPTAYFGTNVNVPQQSYQSKWQIKDAFNWTRGTHGLKLGIDYVFEPKLGGFFKFDPVPAVVFFDDPSAILGNRDGNYPQGFATPGIVRELRATNGDPRFDVRQNVHMLGWYVQDDWKVNRNLTLNLGLRYDVDINLLGASNQDQNRTYRILRQINSPITNGWVSRLPGNYKKNFAPRFGFAYDPFGQGRAVIRGGYGIYYDQVFLNIPLFAIQQTNPTVFGTVYTLQNDRIGFGELAGFRVGDPLPALPPGLTNLPNGALGRIVDPDYKNPMSQQWNIGFSFQLSNDFVFEADYTHLLNIRESRRMRLNPRRVNETGANPRVLESAFVAAGLPRDRLGDIVGESSVNRSRYDGLNLQLRKRLSHGISFQTSYVLSKARGFGARTGEFAATAVFDQFNVFDPREYAPTSRDERHRFVFSGVIDLPWGIQASPILQTASARPYSLVAGQDINRDGITNDLCVPGSVAPNGRVCPQNVAINSQRGGFDLDGRRVSGRFFLMDLRLSKYVNLSRIREGMRLGFFFESFNLTNRVNFGNNFSTSARSSNFMRAAGLPTGTYGIVGAIPFQAQLGFRFIF